jgi:RimJ/RimL family protein N-acetyltransferase
LNIIWGGAGDPAANQAIAAFVADHIDGCERGFADFTTMGVMEIGGVTEAGRLIAGVVYHNYAPEAGVIELSAASTSKRWLTRPVLKAMFGYAFDEIGCQMAVLRVSEENRGMADIARRFGFTSYRIPRLRGRGEAEIIFTLTDDDWRAHPVNRF